MGSRRLLSEEELSAALAGVPGWTRRGAEIEREWAFGDFQEAFAFLTRVALLAEKLNHHPEIWNVWNRVRLRLSTHDAGGLTALDFDLAAQIDAASGR